MSRFSSVGTIINPTSEIKPNSYMVDPNQTVAFNPQEMFDKIEESESDDWRLS